VVASLPAAQVAACKRPAVGLGLGACVVFRICVAWRGYSESQKGVGEFTVPCWQSLEEHAAATPGMHCVFGGSNSVMPAAHKMVALASYYSLPSVTTAVVAAATWSVVGSSYVSRHMIVCLFEQATFAPFPAEF
jgi:hypothetical protein